MAGRLVAIAFVILCSGFFVVPSVAADDALWLFDGSILMSPLVTASQTGDAQSDMDTEPAPDSKTKKKKFWRRGLYIGLGGSYGFHLFEDNIREATGSQVDLKHSPGLNARIGYRLLPFLGAEFEYEWMDGFDAELQGIDVIRISSHTMTGNVKAFIPLGPIQPNVLGGIGATRYKLEDGLGLGLSFTEWALAGRLGGGVDIYLTRHFLFNGGVTVILTTHDVNNPTARENITALYYLTTQFGFQYRF